MQITTKQIKLARIALDWTQSELAAHAGVSKDTIVNMETGKNAPRHESHQKVVEALRAGGIEFLENNGIRERQDYIHRYKGVEGFRDFMDDVYETAREHGGDICLMNSKPGLWHKLLGKDWYESHARRMAELGDSIRVRIIVEEGEEEFVLGSAEHRWFSRDKWRGRIFYAYGPKLGFLNFRDNEVCITVLEEEDFAESFKIIFDVVWEHETKEPRGPT